MDKVDNTLEKQQSYNAKFYENKIKSNQEFYQKEKERVKDYMRNRYQNDPEYRQRTLQQQMKRYYEKKALKNSQISVN